MTATHTRQLGMVGLGRMGANIVRRLMRDGHPCVVYDRNPDTVQKLAGEGATGTTSLDDFAAKLTKPRAAWVMVPAGEITQQIIDQLADRMEPGDIIIDGGNSYYRDDIRRSAKLRERGIHLVDCGTSGGVWGLDRGYCLMIGGDDEVVADLAPIFQSLAPGVDTAPRTPGRTGQPSPAEQGWLHCGQNGAGHFVKMVHNGIEYGMMASLAEGLNVLHNADIGTRKQEGDAETAPLENPEYYQYDIDTTAVAEVWRRGSVIGSWPSRCCSRRTCPTSRDGSRTPAKGAGRRSPRSRRACPRRSCPARCTRGSPHASSTCSRTRRCRPCASSSAGTTRGRRPGADRGGAARPFAGTAIRVGMTPAAPAG